MIILLVYLVIGGYIMAGYVTGSTKQHKDIDDIFKKDKLSKVYEQMIAGYLAALALILIWGPLVITGLIVRIIRKFN